MRPLFRAQPNSQWLAPEAEEVAEEAPLQELLQQSPKRKRRNQNHHLQVLEVDCSEEMTQTQIPMTARKETWKSRDRSQKSMIFVFKLTGLMQSCSIAEAMT